MISAKQRKPAKSKSSTMPVKDLRPTKDAKGGGVQLSGQKKEEVGTDQRPNLAL